ncbi:MAG TPA: glycosyltransferase family 87 protein, partial [Bryobacteraceae bacterium]|nr:glycosyltransferase family 87 protein [Bryobacteraceae bacterium]
LLFVLAAQWLVALMPEVSSDGLGMHLNASMAIARDGVWKFDYQNFVWALMPMGADWAYAVAYVLGGEPGGEGAAKMLDFALLVVVTFMIRGVARRWVPETKATLAAALFASTPLVQLVTGSLFVENVWAAMILGGVLTLLEGELIWAGVLLGTGLAVKLGTIAYIAPAVVVGAVIAIRQKKAPQAAMALVLLVIFAAPTYVTAWHKTGNPVYPFLNQIFRAPSFDSSAPFEDTRFLAPLNWRTLYDITFRTDKYYEGQKGGMGFQYFLLLIPAAFMAKRWDSRLLLAVAAAAAILTFRSLPNGRYLYPALPLFSIGLAETPIGWGMAGVTALNVWFLPASGWYDKDFAVFRRDRRHAYLKVAAPQRELTDYLNRNAPGEAAAYFDGDLTAGLLGQAYSDTWHSYPYWLELRDSQNADQLVAVFRRRHIRYVIAPISGESYFPAARELFLRWTTEPLATAGSSAVYAIRVEPKRIPRPARPFDGAPVAPGDYDDMSHSIEYEGVWASGRYSMASGGTLTYSHGADDTAGLSFNGSGIEYWYTAAFNRGIAQVRIDGREKARVDLYAPSIRWQQKMVLRGLGPGQHTIEIHVLKEKNSRSSDYYVDVDKFVVTP